MAYHYFRVYFHWFDEKKGKIRRENVRLDALNKKDAKMRVIKGEKPKLVAVDKVVKL